MGLPQASESLQGPSSTKVSHPLDHNHDTNLKFSREAKRTAGKFDSESRCWCRKSFDAREDEDVARTKVKVTLSTNKQSDYFP